MGIASNVRQRLTLAVLLAAGVAWVAGPSLARADGDKPAPSRRDDANIASTTDPFAVPPGLRTAVDFWKKIFTVYTTEDAVVHHATNLGVVYSVLDLRSVEGEQRRRAMINREIARTLRRHPGLHEEDIHVQYGIRDRFERGLVVSHRYLPEMEQIFRQEGLPVELTRLPFVESSFNVNAYSKAAASGIWQFIPSTGRLYMRIGSAVDERNDPIISSRAAAQLLKHNLEVTGSWPLAVTAYNHGLGGVVRATRVTGSRNLVNIIHRYRAANFGFASRNFYAEFLAAVEVYRDHARHFGRLDFDDPFAYDEIRLGRPMLVRDLLGAGLTRDELQTFNPALTPLAIKNRVPIPSGYTLRVPLGRGPRMVASLRDVKPVEVKRVRGVRVVRHRVQSGETLWGIARRYGVSRPSLARANGLSTSSRLRRGQVLRVPGVVRAATRIVRVDAPASAGAKNAVLVRRSNPKPIGASAAASSAARSKRVDATAAVLNRREPVIRAPTAPAVPRIAAAPARDKTRIARAEPPPPRKHASRRKPLPSPGAVLDVSSAQAEELTRSRHRAPTVTHIVRRHDTLWKIARHYDVPLAALKRANAGKALSPLRPGTRLRIPVTENES